MISKELLSEVLDIKVVEVYKIGSNPNFKDNTLLYRVEGCGVLFTINIHELAHKCKEWAFCLDATMILSSVSEANIGIASIKDDYGNILICEVCESEPEAIFKACQWLLDNKDEK